MPLYMTLNDPLKKISHQDPYVFKYNYIASFLRVLKCQLTLMFWILLAAHSSHSQIFGFILDHEALASPSLDSSQYSVTA